MDSRGSKSTMTPYSSGIMWEVLGWWGHVWGVLQPYLTMVGTTGGGAWASKRCHTGLHTHPTTLLSQDSDSS